MHKVNVPFIAKSKIREFADNFRSDYWNNQLPVEIIDILEFDLGLDIIPVKNLEKSHDTDASISLDFSKIFLDSDRFESNNYQNRIRFSIAHEIGHYILHKNLLSGLKLKDENEYLDWFDLGVTEKDYDSLEFQANEFAGRLLVPPIEFENIFEEVYNLQHNKNISAVHEFARRFYVSTKVIETRMKHDDDIIKVLGEFQQGLDI